eukprot:TRINITY_DN5305_c0_g1_i10.p1 TRINITY_DN5305_c0_g1~~TRINITY_DN5305_c0_g1_i10.p1  ORF type:complete len:253 (-),score=62.90 TRINITY_DN5305_c0_g1_i10:132-890(-)
MKLNRMTSQTPMIFGGLRLAEYSVEEEMGKYIVPFFEGGECKLMGAGREDKDVRMLGDGRPFILEIADCKKLSVDFECIEELVNNVSKPNILVKDLQMVDKEANKDHLMNSEKDKRKHYRALVEFSKPVTPEMLDKINSLENLQILQKTPIRVLHRRAALERLRDVYTITATPVQQNWIYLDLVTQAGTYVKEFVHGDLGRTKPNLAMITSCDCDILLLDVTAVDLKWPPSNKASPTFKVPEMKDEMSDHIK